TGATAAGRRGPARRRSAAAPAAAATGAVAAAPRAVLRLCATRHRALRRRQRSAGRGDLPQGRRDGQAGAGRDLPARLGRDRPAALRPVDRPPRAQRRDGHLSGLPDQARLRHDHAAGQCPGRRARRAGARPGRAGNARRRRAFRGRGAGGGLCGGGCGERAARAGSRLQRLSRAQAAPPRGGDADGRPEHDRAGYSRARVRRPARHRRRQRHRQPDRPRRRAGASHAADHPRRRRRRPQRAAPLRRRRAADLLGAAGRAARRGRGRRVGCAGDDLRVRRRQRPL
ncbi:MAG: hypothetical protein AVDCRST_MAG67-2213, partial [uncultured Solirubrobacteraceae bacterium]